MSDFDEEAEREKLRKRFAEEDEERETTERMSELLLQGATMTDTHCEECGDPLFRYDGQTFCPTCQRTADESGTEPADATAEPAESTPAESQRIAVTDPRNESANEPHEPHDATAGQPASETDDRATPRTHDRRAPPSRTTNGSTAGSETARTEPNRSAGTTDDLAATEASLSRTLRRQAAVAEETDDLGRTREHLAAAREAAEALAAVRTARR